MALDSWCVVRGAWCVMRRQSLCTTALAQVTGDGCNLHEWRYEQSYQEQELALCALHGRTEVTGLASQTSEPYCSFASTLPQRATRLAPPTFATSLSLSCQSQTSRISPQERPGQARLSLGADGGSSMTLAGPKHEQHAERFVKCAADVKSEA